MGGRCDRNRLVSRTSRRLQGKVVLELFTTMITDAWFHTVPLRESDKFSTIFEVVTHYRDSLLRGG